MDAIFNRRSVRKFLDKAVEQEKTERILRAAMQAPSAKNQQPWEFIVIHDKRKIEKLSQFSPYSKLLLGAPMAVVILEKCDVSASLLAQQDLGACTQNMMLQAVEEGLGTCWMGVGKETDREKFLIDMFALPDNVKPFAVIAVGYPQQQDANKFVDRYDETRIHMEEY